MTHRVTLALLAPLFVVPASLAPSYAGSGAGSGADSGASSGAGSPVSHHGRAAGASADRGDTRHHGRDRVHAPRRVHLLAARLYWGRRPPSFPSTHRMHQDLRQTARFYRRVSRGRQHIHVRVTRWVHVGIPGDLMCNSQRRSLRAATAALRRAGYHPAAFDRLMIFTEQCESAASVAQLPGRVTWIRFRDPGMSTLVHELGHNMGLDHAYGVVCREGARRVALGGHCRAVEYGDSWDAMGHSRGSFSVPTLVRLGWAGRVAHVTRDGTYTLADIEHPKAGDQGLRIRAGRTTYWVEYQRQHSPVVGRTIPGVMIRRQVGHGPVEIVDASPGNPTGIAFPDADLTNPALPVGSSLTTPQGIRFTTVSTGRRAKVEVGFHERASAPDAPAVAVTQTGSGYRVSWTAPTDNGQIVLGYRVTSWADSQTPTGTSTFVRSPAGYHTSVVIPPAKDASSPPTFTVKALNQEGWSPVSVAVTPATASGPGVTVSAPFSWSVVSPSFSVDVAGAPAQKTDASPNGAWAEIGSDGVEVACTSAEGAGPYTLTCDDAHGQLSGTQLLTVHVQAEGAQVTTMTFPVRVRAG
ncbi:MAG TPA: hypothetical protein VHW64_17840 [Nocardioides sp.]|uniref:hypothetical protein n=1 Tax=Nocardioides sp. TaxID=35761 RepID=UPI002E31C8EC|nr:hypothetical protein [Nocardioides sp.]HEX3932562.1 hypothetical protein [Nocardioides sp.]